jgi:hypothetical protein
MMMMMTEMSGILTRQAADGFLLVLLARETTAPSSWSEILVFLLPTKAKSFFHGRLISGRLCIFNMTPFVTWKNKSKCFRHCAVSHTVA